MSLSAPSRRLPIRCLYAPPVRKQPVNHQQRRTALFGRGSSGDDSGDSAQSNPILDEWNRNNPQAKKTPGQAPAAPEGFGKGGDLAAGSIFEDDRRMQEQKNREYDAPSEDPDESKVGSQTRDPRIMSRVLNPDPNARERWERKKVIQMIRKGGRLTKEQVIKRTEREHLVKSHNMKTSVKKLGMVARQIAGKTIDDAIVQMRFSKKKVAQEVLTQLEAARDEAVVMRGMGLGNAAIAEADNLNDTSVSVTGSTETALETTKARQRHLPSIDIQLKDGKRHKVSDRSKIYIDQAWVGRGPYGRLPDYRARGRVFIMRTPWTSLSLVLKEEATRVREWEEREAKRKKQLTEKVWRALPDRPIQIQRQWYSW